MHLKGALHVHSTGSDGELTIPEVVRVHEALGYDFIALTDHDYLLKPDTYDEIYSLGTDLIIFTGMEMTVFERGYCHVGRIHGQREELYVFNHPAQLGLPLEKVVERVLAVAGKLPLNAVEITNYGFRTPEYETNLLPFSKVATDDSHNRLMCGRAWIEMDGRRNKDAILRAIKRGDFWNCFAG